MGEAGAPRPPGPLVWFHAASVGEAASLLEMLRRLQLARPEVTCLVTTVTVTSAAFLADRLPERCIHQFAPLDVVPWVDRFLDHWRPDLAVWTESELWPAMIHETHARGIPMLLINARISSRSYRRWRLAARAGRGADRPFRPHPRPGRTGRRAARGPRRRQRPDHRHRHAQGRRGAAAARRGRARPPVARACAGRRSGWPRPPTPARRRSRSARTRAPAARCRCWR